MESCGRGGAHVLHDDARVIEARQGVLEELVGAMRERGRG